MNITTNGIDLAKNRFSLHGTDAQSKAVLKKTVSRSKLLVQFANFPHCVVAWKLVAAHATGLQELRKLGHDAHINASRFVTLYRQKGKNDNNDAEVTFRHSFASHLLQFNVDIRTIQELLGHSI